MAIRVVNPSTSVVEQTFEPLSEDEIDAKITLAHDAFLQLGGTTFTQRADWMREAAALLDGDADTLARRVTNEMGKPLAQAEAEVHKSAGTMRYYAEHAEQFLAPQPLGDPSVVGASQAYHVFHPIGPILAVMPWNYPIWQVIRFAAPALMAGNVGLLKHASNVPQSAMYLDTLFSRAGFPEGAFQTLLIGSAEVESVIRDPRVEGVTLTGSEPAGRSVAAIAGDEIKKSVLELGGSDPFIVMPSADLDKAISTAVAARTSNNGQACINAKRFIVHRDVYAEFAQRLTEEMEALVVGDPFDAHTQIGPLATEQGRDDVAELVDDARTFGATILTGGTVPAGPGWFYPPTVVADINQAMRLYSEEAFGPVASLYEIGSIDEAIDLANDSRFGLGSAAWTNEPAEQAKFIREINAGTVNINGMTISYQELPFGGTRRSGYGRELAAEGIREFCNLKTVWIA